jgi:methanethiol S-methyltransferase
MTKHILFFLYGIASYAIFLATFLYAIAFVGGFAVPRQLDGPLNGSVTAAIGIDVLLLAFSRFSTASWPDPGSRNAGP